MNAALRSMTCSLCVAALAAVVSPSTVLIAAEAADGPPQTLEFRRVHVPSDRLTEVPLGGGRYVPMSANEFEDGIARLSRRHGGAGPQTLSALRATADIARYDLSLEGGRFSGTVSFDVGAFATADMSGAGLRELPLGDLDIRAGTMRTASGTGEAVIFGRQDGMLAVATPEPGVYTCTFQLLLEPAVGAHQRVLVPLVPALSSTVDLWLPSALRPVVVGGGVTVVPVPGEDRDRAAASGTGWRIETGPRDALEILLLPRESAEQQLAAWTTVSIRGREATITVCLRPSAPWLPAPVRLRKGPEVVVTQVALGDDAAGVATDDVSWRVADDGRGLVVDLPGRAVGGQQPVVVSAVTPLGPRGGPLPLVRVEDAAWSGGGIEIRIASALSLASIDLRHALVVPPEAAARWPLLASSSSSSAGRAAGERTNVVEPAEDGVSGLGAEAGVAPARVFVEEESPQAAVTLSLAPRAAMLDVARVTAVDLSPGVVVGRAACDVRVVRGEAFDLVGRITPGWFVDSVEATAPPVPGEVGEAARRRDATEAGVALDWKVQRDPQGDVLRIGLTTAATPARGLGLRITGHRTGVALGEEFTSTALDMVRFEGEAEGSALLEYRTSPDMTVAFDGPEQAAVPADGRFAPLAEEGTVRARIAAGHRSASQTARLERRRPPLDVRTQVRLTVRDDRLTESFTFECQPVGSDLDAFVVQFSQPLDAPLEWSLLPPATGAVSARRLDPADGRQGQALVPPGGERWLVELVPAARGPVTIRGGRSLPFTRATAVPLAWVEGATTATGQVIVRDVGRSRPRLVNRRLSEVAPDPQSDGSPASVGEFSYGLDAAAADPEEPAAELVPGGDPRAWAWREVTSSWCHASGATEYETVIDVENQGRSAVSLSLPPGRRVQGILVDDARMPLGDRPAAGGNLRIDLPVGRQSVTIVVRTVTDPPDIDGPLGGIAAGGPVWWEVGPASVGIDVPVLHREWRLLLPPGIDVALLRGGLRMVGGPRPTRDWLARLLGAAVRSAVDPADGSSGDPSQQGFRGVLLSSAGTAGNDLGAVLVRGQLLAILAVLAGVAAAVAVLLAARLGSWPMLLVCLVAGVAALWSAPPVDGIARAAWWAAVGTTALLRASGWHGEGRAGSAPVAAAMIAWIAMLCASATAAADEVDSVDVAVDAGVAAPSPPAVPQSAQPLQVFITPATGRGNAAAGESLVLVPEELFRVLVRGQDVTAIAPVRVLATRVAARVAEADSGWGSWRLAVDVDADDGATLLLDQSAAGGRFPAARASLDGAAASCRLEDGGAVLRIAVPQAGRHTIEVDIEPAVHRRGATEVATISVPVSPAATLQVSGLADMSGRSGIVCERMTARGVFVAAPATEPAGACDVSRASQVRLVRSLVPGVAIALQPKTVVSRNDVAWSLDGVQLTASFEVDPGDAIVRSFEVVADPELEFVEPAEQAADAAESAEGVAIRPVGEGRFAVERKSPDRGRLRFEMAFRRRLEEPVGAFDVPAAWLQQAGVDLRTVRFSTSASLAARIDLPAGLVVASIPDGEASFDVRSWREEVLHPLATAEPREPFAPARPRPRLWVERRGQAVRGSQRLAIAFAADTVRLHLDARIDASSTALVTIPLELPADCLVDRVRLVEDDALHPETAERGAIDVHWTRTEGTAGAVVVQRPHAGRFRLEVDARLPGRPAAAGTFPCLRAGLATESRMLVDWHVEDGRLVRLPPAAADRGPVAADGVPRAAGQFERPATGVMPDYVLEIAAPDVARRSAEDDEQRSIDTGAVADQPPTRSGRVELADIRLAADEGGRVWGVAQFEMLPADRAVRLRLPPSWRLFDVSVDGRPVEGVAPVVSDTDNVWEFRLLDHGWPRSVAALFVGDIGRRLVDGEPFALPPPELVGLPCRRVVWTIEVPEWIALRVQEPARIVTADRLAAERGEALDRLEADFDQSIMRVAGSDRERLKRFFAARRAGFPRGMAPAPRAGSGGRMAAVPTTKPVTIVGDAGSLAIRATRRSDATTGGRGLATLSLLAGGAAAWLAARRGRAPWMPPPWAWPWLAAAAGIAWISTLTPAWPGVALVLAAAVALAWAWLHNRDAWIVRRVAAQAAARAPSSGDSTTRVVSGGGAA
jgi:hypothetical protein